MRLKELKGMATWIYENPVQAVIMILLLLVLIESYVIYLNEKTINRKDALLEDCRNEKSLVQGIADKKVQDLQESMIRELLKKEKVIQEKKQEVDSTIHEASTVVKQVNNKIN